MKKIRYISEYIGIWTLYAVLRFLPWRWASHIGGFIGRSIGPRLALSRKARRHIKHAFPDKKDTDVERILIGMWDNLGRVFAEYPHLPQIAQEAVSCPDLKRLHALRDDGKAGVLCGAHLANWEMPVHLFEAEGIPLNSAYRRPNNPYVANLLAKMRDTSQSAHFEKSRQGMMQLVKTVKDGEHIGLLIDQKFNEGRETLFFGHKVRTSSAFAELPQKYNIPLHFGRVVRHDKTSFIVEITEAIPVFDQNGVPRPAEDLIDEYHRHLEQWITEYPEQWLWIHRRWRGI